MPYFNNLSLALAMVSAMDDAIGKLVNAMALKGILYNTLIIFTSDVSDKLCCYTFETYFMRNYSVKIQRIVIILFSITEWRVSNTWWEQLAFTGRKIYFVGRWNKSAHFRLGWNAPE